MVMQRQRLHVTVKDYVEIKTMKYFLLIIISAIFSFKSYALFIKAQSASVLSEAKFGAETIASLSQGTEVQELEENKTWLKIKHENIEGWLPKMALSANPPLGQAGSLLDEAEDISQNARKRASATTTAGAGRGLLAGSDEELSKIGNANFRALATFEQQRVRLEVGAKFLEARFE